LSNDKPEQSDWITVATLGRVRGNRGELTAVDESGRPGRLESLRRVWLFGDGSGYEIESFWRHDGRPIFKFRGVDTISDAEPLVGAEVRVPAEERAPLEAGEYYQADLVGCQVVEKTGASLGRVVEFHEYGGTPLLEVEGGLLIPFARVFCVEIDTQARRIVVDLPEGLKDLNRP
jgi:16S rRNA processing protein RimM